MKEQIAYVIICNCGQGFKLQLTAREQWRKKLNKSTANIANLFEYIHQQHGGTITRQFSDEQPAESEQ